MTRIKILSESRALIQGLSQTADAEAAKIIQDTIRDVAAVDGDRVLDQFEADALKTALDTVVPAGGPVTRAEAGEIKSLMNLRIDQMKSERVKGTDALFTSQGRALDRFRNKILGSISQTLERAEGKPVDVNMMIFSFTDEPMADALLKMAKENPNLHIRLLTDWSQLSTTGSHQAPRLARLAHEQGIDNIDVKFKKDNPYTWDSRRHRPAYNHSKTKGLNHHKGFVTLIDGRPEKMTFGSFNWSKSAMRSNYENLMLLDRVDPDNRRLMSGYEKEFEAFWNNDQAALTPSEARRHKNEIFSKINADHGESFVPSAVPADDPDPIYQARDQIAAFDINDFSDRSTQEIESRCGKTLTRKIQKELRDWGRFDSWTELMVRVPDLAKASTWVREQLMENLEYGRGGLSINSANVEELDRAGLSHKQAERIVNYREGHGAFESLDELDDIRGIGSKTIERLRETLTDDEVFATYSAREPGGQATTGWSASHHGHMNVPQVGAGDDVDVRHKVPANRAEMQSHEMSLSAPVIDMLRRSEPGQTFRLAMYGISPSSREFQELKAAAQRGVKIRAVIYNKYNDKAINALKAMRQAGQDVDLRVLKSRVMHEKFGVSGDDVFNGSANWSNSSSTKHSEDRMMFRNQPALADRFIEEFTRLWERGNQP